MSYQKYQTACGTFDLHQFNGDIYSAHNAHTDAVNKTGTEAIPVTHLTFDQREDLVVMTADDFESLMHQMRKAV